MQIRVQTHTQVLQARDRAVSQRDGLSSYDMLSHSPRMSEYVQVRMCLLMICFMTPAHTLVPVAGFVSLHFLVPVSVGFLRSSYLLQPGVYVRGRLCNLCHTLIIYRDAQVYTKFRCELCTALVERRPLPPRL